MSCAEASATGKSNERSLRYLLGTRHDGSYAGCGWWTPFSVINDSGMADDEVMTSISATLDGPLNGSPSGAETGSADAAFVAAPAEAQGEAETDDYSDAERDEVAARLASLGYIDE